MNHFKIEKINIKEYDGSLGITYPLEMNSLCLPEADLVLDGISADCATCMVYVFQEKFHAASREMAFSFL